MRQDPVHQLAARPLGKRMLITSFVAGVAGGAPLLLYVLFGPPHGNPIGLGLLAVVTVPISVAGMVLGAIIMAVKYLLRSRE